MSKATIWFDFDGTIVDVKERFYKVHSILCRYFKIIPLPKEEYWNARCNAISTKDILKRINAEAAYDEYIKKRNDIIESVDFLKLDKVRKGAIKTLEVIKLKHKVNLLTGRASKQNLVEQLEWLRLKYFFDEIFIVSPYGGWEDKCNVLLKNSSAEDIMVGDNPRDILAGKNAKIKTVAVADGMSTEALLKKAEPDYLVKTLSEIIKKKLV